MKKILTAIIISAIVFVSSCGGVSAKALLEYGRGSFTATLSTSIDGIDVPVSVIKDGGTLSFIVDEKYTFVYNDGNWSVSYSGLTVPISADSIKRSLPQKLCTALTLTHDAGWKASYETVNEISRIKCECAQADVALYFDADSRLPIKISSGGVEFDVLKFDPAETE